MKKKDFGKEFEMMITTLKKLDLLEVKKDKGEEWYRFSMLFYKLRRAFYNPYWYEARFLLELAGEEKPTASLIESMACLLETKDQKGKDRQETRSEPKNIRGYE